MKRLIYRWGSLCEPLFCETLRLLEIDYVEFSRPMKNYHFDAEFAQGMIEILHREQITEVFSYDYFPLIAMLCEINRIPYISWIYDCPQYTLQSKTLSSRYNYIFCFDKAYTERLVEMGAKHCEHYPLSADGKMLQRAKQKNKTNEEEYASDISFIGSLYNEERNRYRCAELTEHTRGWTEGVIEAQRLVYGYNFLKKALSEQDEVVREIKEKCQLQLSEEFRQDDLQMAADILGVEVSARERECVLAQISQWNTVRLYTSSNVPESLNGTNLELRGQADYETELPIIYANSKINLNITSKTIETGIPQRIFDILGCGGFCMTNYQAEIAEFFEEGKEIVIYYNMTDLVEKVDYYLAHEEERCQIARKGRKKVEQYFNMKYRVNGMLEMVQRMQDMENNDCEGKNDRAIEELRIYADECIRKGKIRELVQALYRNRDIVKKDNDLANLYYLSEVYEKELQKEEVTLYKENLQDTLEVFYELQRKLRKLEWWEEYSPQEIYLYMLEKRVSVYELQWGVETVCVDKQKVWRLLNGK